MRCGDFDNRINVMDFFLKTYVTLTEKDVMLNASAPCELRKTQFAITHPSITYDNSEASLHSQVLGLLHLALYPA